MTEESWELRDWMTSVMACFVFGWLLLGKMKIGKQLLCVS
jgi:hypothetical protein